MSAPEGTITATGGTAAGSRPVLHHNGKTRVALPMAYVDNCISKAESDFLWRFFEASDFANGHREVVLSTGEPVGRYADHASTIDPDSYVRFEVQAYKWVREFGLGREWATVAEMFVRMMADRANITFAEWGAYLTNCDDEKVAIGGAQVSLRMLGLRLKDAYRDFFRWYRYVREAEARNEQPTGHGAMQAFEREESIRQSVSRFKRAHGLPDAS